MIVVADGDEQIDGPFDETLVQSLSTFNKSLNHCAPSFRNDSFENNTMQFESQPVVVLPVHFQSHCAESQFGIKSVSPLTS